MDANTKFQLKGKQMTDKAIALTDEQVKAFKQLETAFKKCASVGLEIHGELETLYAINAHGLAGREVVINGGSRMISDEAEWFRPKAFKGCAADDGLGIE